MSNPKILIVGGGIGGLSCATALAETGKFDISIYESDILGGQASSQKSKLCNTEISWRVFGDFYTNISSIIIDINAKKNFYVVKENDTCSFNQKNGEVNLINIFYYLNWEQTFKVLNLFFLCKDRLVTNYHNITAFSYFGKNKFLDMILGPYSGQEPTKVTLSALTKFTYSYYDKPHINDNFSNRNKLTKYSTSDSLFNPWKKYLQNKGVKIYENNKLTNITYSNGRINNLTINNKTYNANEIVFACSLKPLLEIFNKNNYLKNTIINKKMNILGSGQQFYISVNFYWKKDIIKDKKCHIYTFPNGWMPVIIERFIYSDYLENNCNKNIKEVWNIGIADYVLGNYVKKFTSQCTFEEIVYEIKMNIMNSEHFKNYFDFENNTWDDYFYDYEFDDRYYKKLPSTEKFSINKGIEENLLSNNEPELGDNVYFSAYYVKNTVGGASMESSCEIGLTTADLICKKYKVENPRKPIYKTQWYFYAFMIPFVLLDRILYKLNLNPITDYINSVFLLVMYLFVIMVCIFYTLLTLYNNKKFNKYIKRKFLKYK